MARTYKPKVNLNQLSFSPEVNPFLEGQTIRTKKRYVRTAKGKDLIDPITGEVSAVSTIHTVEEKDDQEFVKIFADGVKATHDLTRTAYRVFVAILEEYQSTKMTNGYVDSIYLAWFDDGLSGRSIGMSEETFKRGLRELLDKGFITPKSPSVYWVNPALFFKGDRVAFVKEYRRRRPTERDELEAKGQLRIDDE